MKVLFVSAHAFAYAGGVQKHIIYLKKEFEREDHKVKIVAPLEGFFSKKKTQEKDIFLFGKSIPAIANAAKINLSFEFSPSRLENFLKKEKFDILHFQNLGVFLSFQLLKVSERIERETPHIKVLTLHSFWEASRIMKNKFILNKLNNKILPKLDGLIVVSEPVLKQINFSGPTEIIPNGIDLNVFSPEGKKIEKFQDDPINILFVGRIEERKGLFYLLKAFSSLERKYKNIRLIIVGDGYQRKEMERFVREKKLKNVFFEGNVFPEEKLARYYRSADICCFPSLYGESFGIVLLEAMASGKPVVAFSNKGYRQVLKGEGANFLVKPKDVKGLIEKLSLLIENKEIRDKMGKWGRKEAENYSWEMVAQRTLNFYKKLKK